MTDSGVAVPALVGGLLVGGRSCRFGRPKATVSWRGSTFGESIAAVLRPRVDELVLLGDGEVPEALAGLRRIADVPGARGPLAGVLGGLRARPGSALLVAACDQPLLEAAALSWLLDLRRPASIAVVARLEPGGIEPLPALYEPTSRPVLELLVTGRGSLQPLADRTDVVVSTPPPGLVRSWTSIDTPSALEPFERRASG